MGHPRGNRPLCRSPVVQQPLMLWQTLRPRQRIVVAGAAAAMFAAILFLVGTSGRPSMALLYAGLDQTQAGEVLTALDARAVAYEVRGDAIYVDASMRDQTRMALAGEGVPQNSGAGYELLDSLSGFGTTAQMFDAAYWRATEGELARTIAALPDVRFARVHIAHRDSGGFARGPAPTASVMVATSDGRITPERARAISFLVASAVAGMRPADVSVLDGMGNIALTEDGGANGGTRAEDIRRAVQRLLEARVGPGNAVVELSLDVVTDRETISERKIDPQGRVAISSDTEERSDTSSQADPGAVTVASNLPTGDSGANGGGASSATSETRERTNFEVSETRRELTREPGAVRRLTVAVLVDAVPGAEGTPPEPRGADELAALRDLVAAAVGFDESRGDVITIHSLPFQALPEGTEVAGASWLAPAPLDVMRLVQIATAALVALLLGLFVLRPLLRSAGTASRALPALGAPPRPTPGPAFDPDALTGEIDDGAPVQIASARTGANLALAEPAGNTATAPTDPVSRLRALMAEKRTETAEILRGWMEEAENETAG